MATPQNLIEKEIERLLALLEKNCERFDVDGSETLCKEEASLNEKEADSDARKSS